MLFRTEAGASAWTVRWAECSIKRGEQTGELRPTVLSESFENEVVDLAEGPLGASRRLDP